MVSSPTIRKPFAGDYQITQCFGAPYLINGKQEVHMGVDWALPCGTPVLAAASGNVKLIDKQYTLFDYGINIMLQHVGFETFCAHMRDIVVKPLQYVQKGEVLGRSGKTGFVLGWTGCHLHFGMKIEGRWVDPMGHLEDEGSEPRYVPEPSEKLVPLYRLFNATQGDHFYTVSEKEALNAALNLGYKDEGIIGFIVEPQK